jgi:hypothetical protein
MASMTGSRPDANWSAAAVCAVRPSAPASAMLRGFSVLIAGGARDADTLAAQWAADRGIAAEIYTADWQGQGRKKW